METQFTNKKGNKGEKNEIFYKQLIFENKSNIDFLEENFSNAGNVSHGIEIINPVTNECYTTKEEIKKSVARSKADIIIKFNQTNKVRYISIKSLSGAKPSILNHTPRSAKAFKTNLHECISDIDLLANEYNNKRSNGIIGEDIQFCNLDSFKDENITKSFIKIITYFVFTGTGSRIDQNECDSILIINKNGTLTFIDCDTDEKKYNYIASIIDKCVISFRNKGMPTIINDDCLPWIYTNKLNGKKCGSIHVRL